jgi:hypothetical protein
MWIIKRNFEKTEHDDYVLNVKYILSSTTEALPLYDPENGILTGWKIQSRYE